MQDKIKKSGFSLIEVIVAVAVLMVVTLGVIAGGQLAGVSLRLGQNRVEANRLAKEGMEAALSVRSENFPAISEGVYHPEWVSGQWAFVAGEETLGKFKRRLVVSRVYREFVCEETVCPIVLAGGISDEGSFWVDVEVEWEEQETEEIKLSGLITYWR